MKVPSPCIDVCKYKLRGHCIGCGMTERQKKDSKRLDGRADKLAFLRMLLAQQAGLGRFLGWEGAYRAKCRKKGVPCPLDEIGAGSASHAHAAAARL